MPEAGKWGIIYKFVGASSHVGKGGLSKREATRAYKSLEGREQVEYARLCFGGNTISHWKKTVDDKPPF